MAVQARKSATTGKVTSHRVKWRLNGARDGAWQSLTLGGTKGHGKQAAALDAWLRDVHGYAMTDNDPRIDEYLGRTPAAADEPEADDEPAPSVYALVEAWVAAPKRQRNASTARTYGSILKLLGDLGDMPADAVTGRHLDKWFGALDRNGAAASSQRQRRTVLRSALAKHVSADAFDGVRYPESKRVHRDKSLSERQILDMLAAATANDMADMVLPLRVAVETGMRPSELCGLTAGNVDLDGLMVHIDVQLPGDNLKAHGFTTEPCKHGSARSVPISADLAEALALVRGLDTDAPVFTHDDGDYWSYTQWLRSWQRLVAITPSVPARHTPHALRHTAAIHWLSNGAPMGVVSKWLGHSKIGVTDEHYGQFSDDAARSFMLSAGMRLGG